MVWRLVANIVWRMRGVYGMTALVLGGMWMTAGTGAFSHGALLAVSIAIAFTDGPFMGLMMSGEKELIYLPLSRRQLWLARWIVAVAIPVPFLLIVKLAGIAAASAWRSPHPLDVSTVLLSSVYDLAYVGAGLSLLLWSGDGYLRPSRVTRTVRSWLWLVSVLIFVAGPVWPLLLLAYLPTEWSALAIGGRFLLGAGLGLTVMSLLHEPAVAHPGRQTVRAVSRKRSVASYGTSTPVIGFLRLMWPEIALGVGMVAMTIAVFSFVDPRSDDRIDVLFPYFILCMPTPGTMGPEGALRSIRALPLSTWMLAALLAVRPVLMYVAVWTCQEILRSSFGVALPRLTLGMMCWLIGIASITTAASLKWSGRRRAIFPAAFLFGLSAFFVQRWHLTADLPLGWLPVAAAIAGVATALAVTFHTLRRSHSVYKAVKLPPMFATQGPPA